MKFNNQLDIETYINVTNEIANNFFDKTNGEYLPHFGNVYSVYVYFINCVKSEDGDEVTKDTIITKSEDGDDTLVLSELQKLFNNEEFMKAYNSATMPSKVYALDFSHAHADAIRIVKSRSANNNPLVFGITQLVQSFNTLFTSEELVQFVSALTQSVGSLNEDTVNKVVELADRYKKENITGQKIAEEYASNLSLVDDKE